MLVLSPQPDAADDARLRQDLERRLAECEAALAELNRQLELFAFGVSHDLRAPLRAIDGYARVLEQRQAERLDAEGREQLARIRAAGARMAQLIDGLLEFSRAQRAELRPAPVDFSLLAEWAGAELQDAEPARAGNIRVMPGMCVQGDERLLKVLLERLLGNAWKFSSGREVVEIEVGGMRDGARWQLWVRDRGVGYDPTYAERLFLPFQRLHTPEQGGGAGLGLAIARCIVERHGGRIRAHLREGGGTEIAFDLPVGEADVPG